ncbi:MAG: RNA polymerase sigma factor [candidate division WOR-3 bacterium]
MSDDKQIIEGVEKGDESSCTEILNLYKGRIFSYILRIVKNYDDAEELTFETFIKFFKTIRTYDKSRHLSTWLFTIAHNIVIDFFRRNRIEYEYLDEKYSTGESSAEKYEREKLSKAIDDALQELAPVDREIIILFHKEELSYEEISKITNLPVTTIKTRLHRARKKLQSLLAENE